MAPHHADDEPEWPEVAMINGYALFMGYLSMAIRGMGFLVFLWTTVILLGGFVSMLKKKDFWSLTIITLVQTAGVSNVIQMEKLQYFRKSFFGLGGIISAMLGKVKKKGSSGRMTGMRLLLAYVLLVLQLVVFAVVLCPLAALYLFGLFITAGLSLWRLIQRDYDEVGDEATNLEPALNVIYSLALIQGVLFGYYFFSKLPGERLANTIAGDYGFEAEDDAGRAAVVEYMRQTRTGCEKDPSFAKGRNLVTFAVALMKPDQSASSSGDYITGARILDKLLTQMRLREHHALIRELVGSSASSTQVMEKLLQTLRSTSPLDRDVRVLAARIVAHLAGEISLTSFPHGIRCVSSLLQTTTSEQQDDDSAPSAHYKELMVKGLVILDKLAADEHNRRIISSTQGLLSKVMAPVSADLLHRVDHDAWSDIVAASLQLMSRLVAAPGDTGNTLRSQVLNNKDAINTIEKILECDRCNEKKLYILAIKILIKLPMAAKDASSSSVSNESRVKFTKMLVAIFTDQDKGIAMRQLAGVALAMLSDQSESNATIIHNASDTLVKDLTTILLDVNNNRGFRISAAQILEHLYICYNKDDDYLKNLTEAMKDVLPKVLREVLLLPWTTQKDQKQPAKVEKGTDGGKFPEQNTDIESQDRVASQEDKGDVNKQNEQNVDRILCAALLSLSATIFEKLISDDKDLAQLAGKIAPGDTAFSLAAKLKEMVQGNSEATANCLRILKIATRMIISLINLNVRADHHLERLMQSLSNASKNMLELEGFMIFSSSDSSARTKPVNILASRVKQAQGLLKEKKAEFGNYTSSVNGN